MTVDKIQLIGSDPEKNKRRKPKPKKPNKPGPKQAVKKAAVKAHKDKYARRIAVSMDKQPPTMNNEIKPSDQISSSTDTIATVVPVNTTENPEDLTPEEKGDNPASSAVEKSVDQTPPEAEKSADQTPPKSGEQVAKMANDTVEKITADTEEGIAGDKAATDKVKEAGGDEEDIKSATEVAATINQKRQNVANRTFSRIVNVLKGVGAKSWVAAKYIKENPIETLKTGGKIGGTVLYNLFSVATGTKTLGELVKYGLKEKYKIGSGGEYKKYREQKNAIEASQKAIGILMQSALESLNAGEKSAVENLTNKVNEINDEIQKAVETGVMFGLKAAEKKELNNYRGRQNENKHFELNEIKAYEKLLKKSETEDLSEADRTKIDALRARGDFTAKELERYRTLLGDESRSKESGAGKLQAEVAQISAESNGKITENKQQFSKKIESRLGTFYEQSVGKLKLLRTFTTLGRLPVLFGGTALMSAGALPLGVTVLGGYGVFWAADKFVKIKNRYSRATAFKEDQERKVEKKIKGATKACLEEAQEMWRKLKGARGVGARAGVLGEAAAFVGLIPDEYFHTIGIQSPGETVGGIVDPLVNEVRSWVEDGAPDSVAAEVDDAQLAAELDKVTDQHTAVEVEPAVESGFRKAELNKWDFNDLKPGGDSGIETGAEPLQGVSWEVTRAGEEDDNTFNFEVVGAKDPQEVVDLLGRYGDGQEFLRQMEARPSGHYFLNFKGPADYQFGGDESGVRFEEVTVGGETRLEVTIMQKADANGLQDIGRFQVDATGRMVADSMINTEVGDSAVGYLKESGAAFDDAGRLSQGLALGGDGGTVSRLSLDATNPHVPHVLVTGFHDNAGEYYDVELVDDQYFLDNPDEPLAAEGTLEISPENESTVEMYDQADYRLAQEKPELFAGFNAEHPEPTDPAAVEQYLNDLHEWRLEENIYQPGDTLDGKFSVPLPKGGEHSFTSAEIVAVDEGGVPTAIKSPSTSGMSERVEISLHKVGDNIYEFDYPGGREVAGTLTLDNGQVSMDIDYAARDADYEKWGHELLTAKHRESFEAGFTDRSRYEYYRDLNKFFADLKSELEPTLQNRFEALQPWSKILAEQNITPGKLSPDDPDFVFESAAYLKRAEYEAEAWSHGLGLKTEGQDTIAMLKQDLVDQTYETVPVDLNKLTAGHGFDILPTGATPTMEDPLNAPVRLQPDRSDGRNWVLPPIDGHISVNPRGEVMFTPDPGQEGFPSNDPMPMKDVVLKDRSWKDDRILTK